MNRNSRIAFLWVTILGLLFGMLLDRSGVVERFENQSWDFRQELLSRHSQHDDSIKIIIIDQYSLDFYAQENITWPWPRSLYVPVIRFLEEAGAKGLAFDVLFTETSVHGVEDDLEFADAVGGPLPVVSAVSSLSRKNLIGAQNFARFQGRQKELESEAPFAQNYLDSIRTPRFESATLPVQSLLEKSDAFGVVNAVPDKDGIFRYYRAGAFLEDVPILSLPFALYHLRERSEEHQRYLKNVADEDGKLAVRFHGPEGTYETVNIVDVISSYVQVQEGEPPVVDPKVFRNAWVFLGVWAPGLLDLRPVPLSAQYRGVEFNATVLDNLLHLNFFKRAPFWGNLLWAFLAIVLTGVLTIFESRLWGKICGVLCVVLLFSVGTYGLAYLGYWIAFAPGLAGILFTMLLAFVVQYQLEGRRRQFVRKAFAQYVSPTVIQGIIENPESLALGGERRDLTILFSDIQGFTSISEQMDPTQLVHFLNRYLTELTSIILDTGGTVDKYQGDAILAFWNAPLQVENHAERGVQAALGCQRRLIELQEDFQKSYGVVPVTRIGLHTGAVAVGNFGSAERFDYTVIGDTANLASRLEGVNKVFGTRILFSGATHERLGDNVLRRRIATVQVMGKQESIKIYEPLIGSNDRATSEEFIKFEQGRELYEAGELTGATTVFQELKNDPVAETYLKRIESLTQNSAAIASDYQVWVLDTK